MCQHEQVAVTESIKCSINRYKTLADSFQSANLQQNIQVLKKMSEFFGSVEI